MAFPLKACDDAYASLAHNDPACLCDWIESGQLKETDLTFAVEYLGMIHDAEVRPRARTILLRMLDHEHRSVREGAIYGAVTYGIDDEMRAKLIYMSANDPSAGVCIAANEAID